MGNKLSKYEENRAAAEESINDHLANNQAMVRHLVALGGVGAVGRLSQHLNAQTVRALQKVRDEKMYEALGFARFDDYLNGSDVSPMSYRQFNEREKLLLQEGDQVFDLLSGLRLTSRQRRLLGAGNVAIDDERGVVVIAGAADDCEETEIDIADRDRLVQTLSALADQAAVLNAKNLKLRKTVETGEKQTQDLRRQLDEARERPGTLSIFDIALRATVSIQSIASMVREGADGEQYLDMIRDAVADLDDAVRGVPAGQPARPKRGEEANDEIAGMVESLGDEDLAGLME